MKHSVVHLSVLAALAGADCNFAYADSDTDHSKRKDISAIEFIGMDAPATAEQRASVYSAAKVKIT